MTDEGSCVGLDLLDLWQVMKNAGMSSFRGAGFARPGPEGPSRNDARVFQHPVRELGFGPATMAQPGAENVLCLAEEA
jgi:hypothetical protein